MNASNVAIGTTSNDTLAATNHIAAILVPAGLEISGKAVSQSEYTAYLTHIHFNGGVELEELSYLHMSGDRSVVDFGPIIEEIESLRGSVLSAWSPDSDSSYLPGTTTGTTPIGQDAMSADMVATVHETAISDIVGMIRAKYEDEGQRNFGIGARTFDHALFQKGNFTGYKSDDFETMCNRIRDEVRIFVAISVKSIKLGEWVRCHVLRKLVSEAKGVDAANALSFHEYRTVYGSALKFSTSDLEGSINEGWLDFIMSVSTIRSNGGRVSTSTFVEMMDATSKRIADAKKPVLSPEAQSIADATAASKAKNLASKKLATALNENVESAIVGDLLPVNAILGIVENVAKIHGIDVASITSPVADVSKVRIADGIDMSALTLAELGMVVNALVANGQLAEMRKLAGFLGRAISNADNAIKASHEAMLTAQSVETAEIAAA